MTYLRLCAIAMCLCVVGCPHIPTSNYTFTGRVCYDSQIGNMGLFVSGIVECRDCPAENMKIYISASRSPDDGINGLTATSNSKGDYSLHVGTQLKPLPRDYYYLLIVDHNDKVVADHRLVPGSLDLDFRRNTVFLPMPESKIAPKKE